MNKPIAHTLTRPIRDGADLWFDVPGFEDAYQITADGAVRSKARRVNSPICGGERLLPSRPVNTRLVKGYPTFTASIGRKRTTVYVHRVMAQLFVPNPERKPHVNHIDGVKENFRPENLEWCTHKENMHHAYATGLAAAPTNGSGDKCPASKLTGSDVSVIKARLNQGHSKKRIARDYRVSAGTIYFIATGQTWVSVEASDV